MTTENQNIDQEATQTERQNPLMIVAPDIWERLFNGKSAMTIAVEPGLDHGHFGLLLSNGQVMEFQAEPVMTEQKEPHAEVTSH